MSVPPVSTAISPSIALRRLPKPAALHGTDIQNATHLSTTSGVSFPFNFLGDDQQWPTAFGNLSRIGTNSRRFATSSHQSVSASLPARSPSGPGD